MAQGTAHPVVATVTSCDLIQHRGRPSTPSPQALPGNRRLSPKEMVAILSQCLVWCHTGAGVRGREDKKAGPSKNIFFAFYS